jgi:hypothetical protein
MLYGAGDTSLISDDFKKLVTAMRGDPWHYQSGTISYLNHPRADFRRNSARTVAEADVLVFVILERFGEISWDTELREAVGRGRRVPSCSRRPPSWACCGANSRSCSG